MTFETATRGQNFYEADRNLHAVLGRLAPDALAKWADTLSDFGAWVGSAVDEEAEFTDRDARPVLETYDRDGETVNRIRYNPVWRRISAEAYRRGVVGLNYGDDPAPYLVTFAMGYLLSQSDVSLHCPVTMTGAVAYVLDQFAPADMRARYLPELTRMDGLALTGGTWATEQHGGSDVGATTTSARAEGDHWRLNGLKWFASNADGGLAVATARPEGAPEGSRGLGLYLVPMHLPDGSRNPMRIRRLKDKLGTCGIATGEIDLTDTWALEIAPPPLGLKLMMEALEFSRIHNAMSAAGLQRRAVLEALSYLSHRAAFGHPVLDYPMMRDEVLKMVVAQEAGCALAFEAAAAFDAAHATDLDGDDDKGRAWMRMVTSLAKYLTAEDANQTCRAAIELIGGVAYTYDYVTPRLLRDAQVLTVWEGPANIQALEVLRMIGNRYPGFEALSARIERALRPVPATLGDLAEPVSAAFATCAHAVDRLRADKAQGASDARRLMGLLADTLAAALLVEEAAHGHKVGDGRKAIVARLFIEQRLAPPAGRGLGQDRAWAHDHFDALIDVAPVAANAPAKRAVG
jgi:alkylation response protein AidB-like acyl-CoA dehydrogenase